MLPLQLVRKRTSCDYEQTQISRLFRALLNLCEVICANYDYGNRNLGGGDGVYLFVFFLIQNTEV